MGNYIRGNSNSFVNLDRADSIRVDYAWVRGSYPDPMRYEICVYQGERRFYSVLNVAEIDELSIKVGVDLTEGMKRE